VKVKYLSRHRSVRSTFHAAVGAGTSNTVTLNGKEYSSSKSDKSRRKKADEKKRSKKEAKKREKDNTNNPKTAKQYLQNLRMELEREIRQAEAMDLSIKQEGDEVQHCATFVSHYISGKRLFVKGTTEKDKIPERFMPIQQAYETDDVQLYRIWVYI
jgi:hypothetical protein